VYQFVYQKAIEKVINAKYLKGWAGHQGYGERGIRTLGPRTIMRPREAVQARVVEHPVP
jgi:hypothetical protein